ncbi:hypothetical protein JCM17846_02390 [Iodidimonas nitroreducens]|uniref:ABC-2 type transporter transmembrane domain-containing protein n=1 Tax=Iodidimonas nitroreducens TaxID=1236968 RepID=A0A5A7N3F1_9PROT|nr:ABC transporter permease [Iodidimonas nitroreducens]GAK34740.1 putative protein [alpha proteobacterium Q-1]GER02557.1 hypothetical protein JCM17846_02390 [Iodidimonas nitroreducens]
MMRSITLIARHEFIEAVRSKSFLFSLFLIPAMMAVGMFVPRWLEQKTSIVRNVAVEDMTVDGLYGAAIRQALERAEAKEALADITSYVRAYAYPEYKTARGLDPEKVPPLLLKRRSDMTDADADAYLENGGLAWAINIAMPFVKPGSPPPVLEPSNLRLVDLPPSIDRAALRTAPADALRPWLKGEQRLQMDEGADEKLHAVMLIQPDARPVAPDSLSALGYGGADDVVQLWSDGALKSSLSSRLEDAVDDVFQKKALIGFLGDEGVLEPLSFKAPLMELDISAPKGRSLTPGDMIAQFLPQALSWLLIYFLYINMFMLMSNTMEEKSSRIIEVLVSSVTPNQLMVGKLLGSSLVAITMFAFSIGAFIAVIMMAGGSAFVEFSSILMGLIVGSPILPAMLINFVLGYFLFAGIFLTLGAFCENSRDVQNLSTPMVILMLVVPFVVSAFADDPNGASARILSWLPFFGPFMMMARAAAEPALIDVIGSVIVQLITIVVILWGSGKVFRLAVLFSGKPPKISQLLSFVRSSR